MRRAAGLAGAWPRHTLLGALVLGCLLARLPLGAVVLAAAAMLCALAQRPRLALAAGVAVCLGAGLAHARLVALDHSALAPLMERTLAARAVLLEPPHRGASGARSAMVRLRSGAGQGERLVLRTPGRSSWEQDAAGPVAAGATSAAEDVGAAGGAGEAAGAAGDTEDLASAAGEAAGAAGGATGLWPSAVAVGDVLDVRGRLVPLGAHDGYERTRGAHGVLRAERIVATGERRGGVPGALDGVRRHAEAALGAGLAAPEAALLRGMVLGDDSGFTERQRDDFRAAGLSHLTAASGQNVMLLAALVLGLLTALGLGLRARLTLLLGAVALYVPLAGGGPSIQRAGIMAAAGILAGISGRPGSRLYALGLAALGTLLLDPRAASDPGWQLSFAAVVAITVLAGPLRERLARRLPGGLAEALALTAAATLGTAPLIAVRFGQVSLAALPANVLVAPVVAPIMWLGAVAAAVGGVVPALARLPNGAAQFPLGFVEWLAHAAAAAPGAGMPVGGVGAAAVAAACAAIVAALFVRRLRAPLAAVALPAVALALALGRPPPPLVPHGLTVSFLDIGQGDATLLQQGAHAVLVDTGPPGDPLLARLGRAGVRHLDLLVVTHAQADHEGRAAELLRRMPVGMLLDGGSGTPTAAHWAIVAAARAAHVPVLAPAAGQELRVGPLRLSVLWPTPAAAEAVTAAGGDPNGRAIVLLVHEGGFRLLLTADAESDVTAPLDIPPVDVLKVAHHGSSDPGRPALLARLRPRIAVIEVGAHNTYGHPTPEALRALRAVPQVLRTDRDGTVRLTVEHGRMTLATVH